MRKQILICSFLVGISLGIACNGMQRSQAMQDLDHFIEYLKLLEPESKMEIMQGGTNEFCAGLANDHDIIEQEIVLVSSKVSVVESKSDACRENTTSRLERIESMLSLLMP